MIRMNETFVSDFAWFYQKNLESDSLLVIGSKTKMIKLLAEEMISAHPLNLSSALNTHFSPRFAVLNVALCESILRHLRNRNSFLISNFTQCIDSRELEGRKFNLTE